MSNTEKATPPRSPVEESAAQQRHYKELRDLLPQLRAEADALRKENAWLKRWVKELREALAVLTAPNPS